MCGSWGISEMAPKKKGIAAIAPMKRAMKVALPSLGDKSKAEVAPPKETQKRQLPLVAPMKRARRINNAAADRELKTSSGGCRRSTLMA